MILQPKDFLYLPKEGKILEPFQIHGIIGNPLIPQHEQKSIYSILRAGHKKILAVSPGGSGKTVMMAKVACDFINATTKDVAIFVHRKELLNHSRIELDDWYGIYSQKIDALTRNIQSGIRVFVCMVETFDRRSIESFLKYFDNVGLYMVDECHLQHFNKIFDKFPNAIRIGWTATPMSANKKRPLILDYDDIIIMATIPQLIELNIRTEGRRGIVSCEGYDFTIDIEVDESKLKRKGDDFDEKSMGSAFGGKKQLDNVLAAIETHAKNKKLIMFNSNIEHSLLMHNAMLNCGWESQHIDSDNKSKYSSSHHREFIFGNGRDGKGWLESTPNGILNNVGIATIGTDIKSVEGVGINKKTLSFTNFWQMVYRANRAYVYPDGSVKDHFILLDFGNNILPTGCNHGRYYDPIDWEYIFRNPNKPRPGVPAIKVCPECRAINSAQASICTGKTISPMDDGGEIECGFIFNLKELKEIEIDLVERKMILLSKKVKVSIDVGRTIELFKEQGRNENVVFYETIKHVCVFYKKIIFEGNPLEKESLDDLWLLDEMQFKEINAICLEKVSEWFKLRGKKKWANTSKIVKQECIKQLGLLGFNIAESESELVESESESESESEFESESPLDFN